MTTQSTLYEVAYICPRHTGPRSYYAHEDPTTFVAHESICGLYSIPIVSDLISSYQYIVNGLLKWMSFVI